MRRNLWLGIAVSALLLWVAFRGVEAEAFWHATRHVRLGWLAVLALATMVRFGLTAVRWSLLVRPVKTVGLHRLFGVTMIGFMANQLLPARIGELVRAYGLARTESLPMPPVVATLVLERVFDGLSLLLFLVGGSFFLRPEPWMVWSAVLSGILYLGGSSRSAACAIPHDPARLLAPRTASGTDPTTGRTAGRVVRGWPRGVGRSARAPRSNRPVARDLVGQRRRVPGLVRRLRPGPPAPRGAARLRGGHPRPGASVGARVRRPASGSYGRRPRPLRSPAAVALALSFVSHLVNATLIVAVGLVYLNAYDLSFGRSDCRARGVSTPGGAPRLRGGPRPAVTGRPAGPGAHYPTPEALDAWPSNWTPSEAIVTSRPASPVVSSMRSRKITVDIYGHLVPGANKAAVDRLDDTRLSATSPQPRPSKGQN